MAQPRPQTKQSSSVNPQMANTLPATRDRQGSLVPNELRSWAASPFSIKGFVPSAAGSPEAGASEEHRNQETESGRNGL
jgi:hypothetical protein